MEGSILIHRKLLDSYIFTNASDLKIWLWLLLKARYKKGFALLKVGTAGKQPAQNRIIMELRPYQIEFNVNLAKSVVQNKRVIACLPTGGGKTKCFIEIANRAMQRGKTVLIISETRKIFQQITGEASGIEIKAGAHSFFGLMPNRLYIAMAQTLTRRPLLISQLAELGDGLLIINDEAHIGTSTKLLRQFPNALLVGFTATPDWNSGKHLSELYKDCVVGAQVDDLIQAGFLTPYKHFARVGADMNALQIKNGDFTEESQQAAFETTSLFAGLVNDLKNIPYRKALVFAASIKHCRDLLAELEFAGLRCTEYHSQCEHASYNLHQFMDGDVNICVSVAALTKGFDFPPIDLIAIVRATLSLPLFLQMIGRGSRLSSGKSSFTVLDYGANYTRFGLWDMDRDWNKMWLPQKKRKPSDKVGVAPVKSCENCQAIIPTSALVCPYCAELQPKKERTMEEGELVEITEKYSSLVGKRISQLSAHELATYAKIKNKKGWCIRVARAKEQKEQGFLAEFAAAMNYKKGWVNYQEIGSEPIEFYDTILR